MIKYIQLDHTVSRNCWKSLETSCS